MNGKTSRLLRRFVHWAGIRSQADVRARKRAWDRMSHKARGRTRAKIKSAMANDPRRLQPYRQTAIAKRQEI